VNDNAIRVRRSRWKRRGRDHHYWIVEDFRGPKVFVRQFVFSYFAAAIKEADRLARTGLIDPKACFGCQRVEYSEVVS